MVINSTALNVILSLALHLVTSFRFKTSIKACSRDMPVEGLKDHVSASLRCHPRSPLCLRDPYDQPLQIYLLPRLHPHHFSRLGYLTVGPTRALQQVNELHRPLVTFHWTEELAESPSTSSTTDDLSTAAELVKWSRCTLTELLLIGSYTRADH